ncbi:DUF1566 domain-containing protein [Xanthomonas sp. XNM01]|uniref:Lcl C-terminal domain-containing protein n=1 Tax=Xanthomonas sp. XNM01 TaxID=2769289 RepID=UPI0017818C30|nr:DUF1566 domain-containing protein [Xanthomonas sp. XNM01]MBD9368821.1 DUF1566 domain-containing protein [Xanthomonas sp. XNM01]
MSLTVNIRAKHLSVSFLGAQPPLPPEPLTVISTIDLRQGDIWPRTRIAADGTHLSPDDTTTPHVAVIDHTTGLMWAVESLGDPTDSDTGLDHAASEERCAELRLLGFDDWRLPTRAELVGLVDDTRHEPAIDTALFPRVKPRWHWTSTPAAWSSASAWLVYFYDGYVNYDLRRYSLGFALAVRRAGQ